MDNVQFEGDAKVNEPILFQNRNNSFMVRIAMKLGAKNNTQAQLMLLGFVLLIVAVTAYILIAQFTNVIHKSEKILDPYADKPIIFPPRK